MGKKTAEKIARKTEVGRGSCGDEAGAGVIESPPVIKA
ncbi:hypothetical protein SHD_0748 [Shewanella decolorationis S12]|uniref:Uncharacterized protein n=1 Tax=Shewanella decolorationis S12 TaxID=1353536 RepID=A0ABN0PRG5_9GAMM|nr:hypothetical protein SHD_0748 [Shewanella decolorationis S12]